MHKKSAQIEKTDPMLKITDPTFDVTKKYSFPDTFFLRFINDKRDLPFVHLSLKITLLVIPSACFLFLYKGLNIYLGLIYMALNFIFFLGPFVLMLHNTSHRKLFKKKYKRLNNYIPWVLGPFFGQTPETYFHHHIQMHHLENNLEHDLSSTLHFRRDSIMDFMNYFISFLFTGMIKLSTYFKKKSMRNSLKMILIGECTYFLFCLLLLQVNWKATLFVFIFPLIFVRFAMIAGNWAQHAFIDPSCPENIYRNSITCINSTYNKKCFNDGYHIGHHLKPGMHWTEMPNNFLMNLEKYAAEKAIVFHGLDFFQIWFLLMTRNYSFLAKRTVSLDNTNASRQEIIQFLKQRTAPVVLPVLLEERAG